MGEVYEAEDTRKHRSVALKLITPVLSGNPAFRTRMQREADAAGRLTDPHVVPIHDYGEIDGQMFVEMRLIEGNDLGMELKRSGPLAPARAVAVIEQVAAALDAAHIGGITHRDIKPENILLTRGDFAYLVDFGIARAAADPSLTQTGMALGTYNYMAPERFSGGDVDHRADIYSLACVLSECLSGQRPYRTETVERLIASHLMEPAPRPSQLRPGLVPAGLDQVIESAGSIRQCRRPGTGGTRRTEHVRSASGRDDCAPGRCVHPNGRRGECLNGRGRRLSRHQASTAFRWLRTTELRPARADSDAARRHRLARPERPGAARRCARVCRPVPTPR